MHKMDRRTLVREPAQLRDNDLARIRCPALLVKPAASALPSPEFVGGMAASMGAARMVMLEKSSHHALLDNPSGLIAVMRAFLAELPA